MMDNLKSACLPPDSAAREQALDVTQSFIVQAPAGSGKTELLIQRILTLLATVDKPEQILAITFTRKAAGEMKERLLSALERASDATPPEQAHEKYTWERAVKALARDTQLGWDLRANPSRLQIMTIDSYCSNISRRMPWLTRLGDQPGISEDPEKLYRQAAENFLAVIESGGPELEPVARLLRHLDNRLDQLRDLLVKMLARRDQWIRHVIGQGDNKRTALENALQSYIRSVLVSTHEAIGEPLFSEMLDLGHYAAQQLDAMEIDSPLASLLESPVFDPLEPDNIDKWLGLCHLLLTSSGTTRKTINKNIGFTADKTGDAPVRKAQLLQLLEEIERLGIAGEVAHLRLLPSSRYNDSQWSVLDALVEILPLVVVELQSEFRRAGTVDFIEVAGAALAGLGAVDDPGDLLLKLDNSISHILVDEFQDTSYSQYELLYKLTSGWQKGDGRSLFIVGDPMQSIYLFREADVGLFLQVCRKGLGDIELTPLILSANFRSQKMLVENFNATFNPLFPVVEDGLTGAVRYSHADPVRDFRAGPAVTSHIYGERQDANEAEMVLSLVHQARDEFPDGTCAILVRSRSHLYEIVRLLNTNSIPFQSQDVDPLADRPVVSDLQALTRAILHPGDRVAWMAVLRAPWCGLTLADLLHLAAHDRNIPVLERVRNPPRQQDMFSVLSTDGQKRLNRVIPVLEAARKHRGDLPLARLVESTWQQLGGPACVDAQGCDDAIQFFTVLRRLEEGGDLPSFSELSTQLEALFAAPDPHAGNSLQLMTIHKAKGLEFDTVILPGLGRGVKKAERQLLRWLEHPDHELLLAPIPAIDGEDDSIYKSIGTILQQRENNESLRLLYVAATRARERLHLLGHVREGADGPSPLSGSLLAAVWPALDFEAVDLLRQVEEQDAPEVLPTIKRLPTDFILPMPAPCLVPRKAIPRKASEIESSLSMPERFSLRSQEGRIVGKVVHLWMERFAENGVEPWQRNEQALLKDRIKKQLIGFGIPSTRIDECTGKALRCLENVLNSERASWLLGDRSEGACELSVSGIVDGELMHASIDRTFVDKNVRWIVDYKTTTPATGEKMEEFLAREADKYRPQLMAYMQLISAVDESNQVKGALYFPAIDAWQVVVE